jgi:amino acid transporter
MADSLHAAATHHLPMFITPPGATDVLMVVLAVVLAFLVVMFGVFFFRLHSLPERIAHKTHKVQLEIVSVLCLISLFTHMHMFWIAGLLLAFIYLPDFGSPLGRIAGSVEKMAGIAPDKSAAAPAEAAAVEAAEATPEIHAGRRGDGAAAADKTRKGEKELSHV